MIDVTLTRGDCLEAMKLIPDGSIDMVLCDLPFGTTRNKWDSVIPLGELWAEYHRIVKPSGAIVLFAQLPFTISLGASNLKELKYKWTWIKTTASGFLNAKKAPLKSHEDILVFYRKPPTYNPQIRQGFKPYKNRQGHLGSNYGAGRATVTVSNGERYPVDVLTYAKDRPSQHPTQKPVALLEYLIRTYTNEGETVLDNTMGSGSTGVACMNTGRKFIGIELDEAYFSIASQRIEDAKEGKQ